MWEESDVFFVSGIIILVFYWIVYVVFERIIVVKEFEVLFFYWFLFWFVNYNIGVVSF